MNKIFPFIAFVMIALVVITGCKKDDHTGYSTLEPVTGVTLTITPNFTSPVTLVEADSTFNYTVTMNQAQLVDVKLYVSVTATSATAGEDFDYLGSITIPAGGTTASGWIKIMQDDVFEEEETLTIEVGDATFANADLTPVSYSFTLQNYSEEDLQVTLAWEPSTDIYDTHGDLYTGDGLADMILTIYDVTGDSVFAQADGSTYEELILSHNIADGEYRVMASFYGVTDLGDQGSADLNLSVNAFQVGIQDNTLDFENVLNTVNNIDNTIYLAVIDKVGSTWTLSEFGGFTAAEIDFASAVWSDGLGDGWMSDYMYPNHVVIAGSTGEYTIEGICWEWMSDFWGETYTNTVAVDIVFNDDGTIVIPDQYYATTIYNDAPYDYNIYTDADATSTWNRFMTPVALTINYQMDQDGFLPAVYFGGSQYNDNTYFICDIVQTSVKGPRNISKPKKVNVKKPY